ncbi:hypothetical protein BD311DRAFT_769078 [Dichomitus squalens]|uniref:Uncharacterized protein n=1 Tax=Dichomitus squalens TaxID=114155 RepID=A0A4Q9MB37_9APHY|nr:hypothetical protein BD311DRAFT_769078 [Dichomitus squalens]
MHSSGKSVHWSGLISQSGNVWYVCSVSRRLAPDRLSFVLRSESLGVRRRGMSVVMMNLIGYVEAVWLWIDPHYDSHLYPQGA